LTLDSKFALFKLTIQQGYQYEKVNIFFSDLVPESFTFNVFNLENVANGVIKIMLVQILLNKIK
jgi:hypothetical protein